LWEQHGFGAAGEFLRYRGRLGRLPGGQRVPGSCFQSRQDMIDCRLIFPSLQHTVKYLFVYTSAIAASEKPRRKGGLQCFVTAAASSVASQLLQGGEEALGLCLALQAEALRRDEFSQVPVQRSGLEISAHSGKTLSAANSARALQMLQLERVPPKPMGKTGVKDAAFCEGVPECRLQARLENTKCSGLGHALQQNENEMFKRYRAPVSLLRAVLPCIASLMKKMVTYLTVFVFTSFLFFFR